MSFNLFGPADKCDIRVGYISTTRGYVDGVNRYEANKYAKLNPGTQFILRRRDKIQFMNINGVNRLEPKDLLPGNSSSGNKGCSGITGLDIYDDDGGIRSDAFNNVDPHVIFSGGNGIGAKANPIFGIDGSLLAVDLIDGGWGYAYAPVTEVIDEYGIGAGTVVRAIMVGDPEYSKCAFVETVQTFENEEDFEEYDLSTCGPSEIITFGKRYDANGNVSGVWDPTTYATLKSNPAEIEQRRYQDFLESLRGGTRVNLQDNTIRNWWTTQREKPLRVTALNKKSRVIHKVTHPAWSEFMNRYAVSPVPPSNVSGSDFAGIEHTLEWEEDFPYDGDYNFRYAADNVADIYLDNVLVGRTTRFKDSPDKLKKFVTAGVHRIRVDLENIPILTKIPKKKDEKKYINTEFEVYGQGSQKHRAIKFSFTSEGGVHSFVLDNVQKSSKSYKKEIRVLRNTNYKVVAVADSAREEPQIGQREFKIQYGSASSTSGKKVVNKGREIEFDDDANDGFDVNASLKIKSSSPGLSAKFSDDGTKLIVKGQNKGDVTIRLEWNDNPQTSGIAVGSVTIGDATWTQSGQKGGITKTVNINKISNTKSNSGVIEQGTMQSFGVRDKERGNKPGKVIFADYVGSANDNDDMQVRVNRGTFTASNKKVIRGVGPQGSQKRGSFDLDFRVDVRSESGGSSSSNSGYEMEEVFNTKKSINDADRKLWRINPEAGRDGDFLSRFGVLPFNPQSKKATTDDFSGTHIIRWEYVDFPITGNYNLEIMVDDSAEIYIGNRSGDGKAGIGNGLNDINNGGDEVIIKKQGFISGRSSGKSFETRFFKAGKYRIRVELKQIRGKPLAEGNPMAFAMRIKTTVKEKKVVSAKSWNENPMGVALSIDSPLPPVPQGPKPQQEGRCPNNPYWTTRFPGSKEKWFPVTHPAWSAFTNRYAMSPVLPLSTPDSDNGGQVFRTSWVIDAPYDGFYGMKGTVDNGGRILVDDRVILEGGLGFNGRTLEGFKSDFPKTVKFPLQEGKHTITVEVINQETDTFKRIKKKIFDTSDWAVKPKSTGGGETKVTYIGLNRPGGDNTYPIRTEGASSTAGRRVKDNGKTIEFDDDANDGFDVNASLKIQSTSSGVTAKFNGDGSEMIVKGNGDVSLKFEWDDKPSVSGLSVGTLKVGRGENTSFTATQTGTKGSKTKTIKVGSGGSGGIRVSSNGKKISLRDGDGDDTNASFEITSGKAKFSQDGKSIEGDGKVDIKLEWDDDPNNAGVAVEKIKIKGVTWTQSGRKGKQKQSVTLEGATSSGLKSGSAGSKGGVTYAGPTELASYRKGFISPLFQDINLRPNEEIQGKTWVMRWENVDFPVDGTYKIRTEVDDFVDVFVDGVKIQSASIRPRSTRNDPVRYQSFNATKGKKSVELRLSNRRFPNTGFQQNPVVVKVDIIVDTNVSTGKGRSWTTNPVGISAILIPPPCPLKIVGKGKICQVVVDDPGNGFPKPPDSGTGDSTYPVAIVLDDIEVINPGINYNCGVDQLVIEPSNGVKLSYECDTFGRITKVNILPETPALGGSPFFGRGFTKQPEIRMITDTGINFQAVPRFSVVRDPVDPEVLPEQILQVTDLVGLKQTGYIDGRPYYGQVFYKEGVRYAGVYETPGQLIPVYDTLKESIDAEVTTPPSAILRQGTDISSNDPRLNIPGTTDNLS